MLIKVEIVKDATDTGMICRMQNYTGSVTYNGEIPEGLLQMMEGHQPAYFEATIIGEQIRVDYLVEHQSW